MLLSAALGWKWLYAIITVTEKKTNTKERKAIAKREPLLKKMPKLKQQVLGMIAVVFNRKAMDCTEMRISHLIN